MMSTQQRIVVGIDDSPAARNALAWALREAELRHARLDVLYAFNLPVTPAHFAAPYVDPAWMEASAKEALDEIVDAATARFRPEGVTISQFVAEGPPGGLLVEAARHADLLVVGARGGPR